MTPIVIKHTGIAVGNSCAGAFGAGPVDTGFCGTYAAYKEGSFDLVGATLGAPNVMDLENVVKVRVLIVQLSGNSAQMLLTSAAGTDQAVQLSSGGQCIMFEPAVGSEITGIKFVGDGSTVSYLIAGDLT